jgi:hypothetical protein
MSRTRCCLALVFLLVPRSALAADTVDCQVTGRFSSQGSVGRAVTDAIRETKERLTIALYGFDNTDLGDELLKLAQKNIVVRLKVDTARSAGKKMVRLNSIS